MIRKDDIHRLVESLAERQALLYHACQLQDFASYLDLGGIPSRAALERSGLDFTPFVSDDSDKEVGVWDKVFLNLHDFGSAFERGFKGATPTVYGPILLILRASILEATTDVAVCLHTVFPPPEEGFHREDQALSTVDEVLRIYKERSRFIKNRQALEEEFERVVEHYPEVSCSAPDDLLPWGDALQLVRVDPHQVDGDHLLRRVELLVKEKGIRTLVKARTNNRDLVRLYREVVEIGPDLNVKRLEEPSERVKAYVAGVKERRGEGRHRLFLNYLSEGTLRLLGRPEA
jgi:hypothetical protein